MTGVAVIPISKGLPHGNTSWQGTVLTFGAGAPLVQVEPCTTRQVTFHNHGCVLLGCLPSASKAWTLSCSVTTKTTLCTAPATVSLLTYKTWACTSPSR